MKHFVCPNRRLGFEFGTVSHLERARTPAGEEVGDLFPGEVLGLFELHEEGIVFGCELELGSFWSRRGFGHTGLSDDTGRSMIVVVGCD